MQQAFGGITLFVMILALWTRRSSLRTKWEGGPTLVVVSAIGATVLMSTTASEALSRPLYALTGLWNVEDLLGHLMALACACALAYVVMGCFSDDDETLSVDFQRIVGLPLTLAVPTLITLFVKSFGSKEFSANFPDIGGTTASGEYLYLELYWIILSMMMLYTLGWTVRHLLELRRESAMANLYLGAAILAMAFFTALAMHALTPLNLSQLAWWLGCLSVIGLAAAPAVSWRRRCAAAA